ncbi:MAG TPA: DUF1772 domain-containing protein [Pseudolabrys sp.]|nr:DUF1772 domain-containing protein [Pseudolabrys sp.]
MFYGLQIASLLLVSITMALSLTHALEFPGKMRLPKDQYLAIQTVYYPGFTIGGIAEPLSILATLALLTITPTGQAFWLIFAALIALAAAHAVFWLVTQPVNKFWLAGEKLSGLSASFFGKAPAERDGWMTLRDRWEYSHVARAFLSAGALVLLIIAVTLG